LFKVNKIKNKTSAYRTFINLKTSVSKDNARIFEYILDYSGVNEKFKGFL